MAPAAWEQDMRPAWWQKAAISRTSRAQVQALRRAGRRKVLIRGRASVKIMRDSFHGGRGWPVTNHHSTGRPDRLEGVSFVVHCPTDTKVERNFKKRQR